MVSEEPVQLELPLPLSDRDRIVAWLRREQRRHYEYLHEAMGRPGFHTDMMLTYRHSYAALARAIERGEHLSQEPESPSA